MGYRLEKLKIEGKWKLFKWIGLGVLVLAVATLAVWNAFCPIASWKYYFSKPELAPRRNGELRIHFLDVGQGDCTLLELPDGKTALIDGANDSDDAKKRIMRYLNALEIDVIDYLVVTHADGDHCGALEEVFKYKTVLNAYLPVVSSPSGEYGEAYAAAMESGCKLHYSSRAVDLSQREGATTYTLSFLYPYTYDVDSWEESGKRYYGDNDSSAAIWLDYMGASALFTGDLPVDIEEELVRDAELDLLANSGVALNSTEILKVGHHGSGTSTGETLLSYLNVKTAVISCGKDNLYGHPDEEVVGRLAQTEADVYRTDKSGHIVVTVAADGNYKVTTVKP